MMSGEEGLVGQTVPVGPATVDAEDGPTKNDLVEENSRLREGLIEAAESMRIIRKYMGTDGPPTFAQHVIWTQALQAREERARKWLTERPGNGPDIDEAAKEKLRQSVRDIAAMGHAGGFR